jgi:hypothetical protein
MPRTWVQEQETTDSRSNRKLRCGVPILSREGTGTSAVIYRLPDIVIGQNLTIEKIELSLSVQILQRFRGA